MITENIGLNVFDLNDPDFNTKFAENWFKLDAYAPLSVLDQIDLASLPVTPTDGDKYIVDSSDIYIRQAGQWKIHPLVAGQIFHDVDADSWFKYDGVAISGL